MISKHVTEAVAHRLASCKAYELREIALKSGVKTIGTKAALESRLLSHYQGVIDESTRQGRFSFEDGLPSSVLSVDLGYRNLAFVQLTKNNTVKAWSRVDLELPSFHPSVAAPLVREFVKSRLMPLMPSTGAIAVEQQRARSNGSFGVFEVTLRVNCVEAMLWCALHEVTEGRSMPKEAIPRQIVDGYWKDTLLQFASDPSTAKLTGKDKKQAGTRLVEHWLENNHTIHCSDTLKAQFAQESKKDDLSDCLLQALTWYQWRRFILEYTQNAIK
ncbi:ribonuclease H-like domain-containing protein [Radiomyces spectabilis]|uniref:ribonuclease H-like domain-containing protein n=1 Tax=Radiomyces spectabilis TaxID=64574 RepID=UPI00221F833D|nr:ribonuclease H-like domain-containing protein [Radiomyces spectabilis]KAI8376535.1 ribonuclease H-like domain-containing protein [Radiomyces spectabilis]